jgi:hypothetical protein
VVILGVKVPGELVVSDCEKSKPVRWNSIVGNGKAVAKRAILTSIVRLYFLEYFLRNAARERKGVGQRR